MGNGDKRPDRRIKTVEQDRPPHAGALEQGRDVVRDLPRSADILLFDFDQDVVRNPPIPIQLFLRRAA